LIEPHHINNFFLQEKGVIEQPSKRYFQANTFRELVLTYPYANRNASQADLEKEIRSREEFIDFALGLLHLNPLERWSPQQARMHPFITGQPWNGPFRPPTEFRPKVSSDKPRESRRPRATTIDSTKVSSVPPQLQRIAAVHAATAPRTANHGKSAQQQPQQSSPNDHQPPEHHPVDHIHLSSSAVPHPLQIPQHQQSMNAAHQSPTMMVSPFGHQTPHQESPVNKMLVSGFNHVSIGMPLMMCLFWSWSILLLSR
jgi:hypothetical protein